MNFIGHAYCTLEKPELVQLGNILGDFFKGNLDDLNEEVKKGVVIHRKIDELTDNHPDFITCKNYFRPYAGKLSAACMDIIMDYQCTLHWHNFFSTDKSLIINDLEKIISKNKFYFKKEYKTKVNQLLTQNILSSYGNKAGLSRGFEYLSSRTGIRIDFLAVMKTIDSNSKLILRSTQNVFEDVKNQIN